MSYGATYQLKLDHTAKYASYVFVQALVEDVVALQVLRFELCCWWAFRLWLLKVHTDMRQCWREHCEACVYGRVFCKEERATRSQLHAASVGFILVHVQHAQYLCVQHTLGNNKRTSTRVLCPTRRMLRCAVSSYSHPSRAQDSVHQWLRGE